jgi:hypothetical protein
VCTFITKPFALCLINAGAREIRRSNYNSIRKCRVSISSTEKMRYFFEVRFGKNFPATFIDPHRNVARMSKPDGMRPLRDAVSQFRLRLALACQDSFHRCAAATFAA